MTDIIEISLLIAIFLLVLLQRLVPRLNFAARNNRMIILDTCALIDGRIADLVQAGFIPDALVIPQFVVKELQLLADGHDSHKRERARFGLDMAKQLQGNKYCDVTIDRTDFPDIKQTDDKLVALAKKRGAMLYTTDYNLNKVAEIEGVHVLNVNELAQNLRPLALPGERHTIKIMQKGSNRNQGVGYLDDGTMVVAENSARFMGKQIDVEVTRVFQTVAGKMIFATPVNGPSSNTSNDSNDTGHQRHRRRSGK